MCLFDQVRLQSEGVKGKFSGVLDCVRQTLKREGPRGLYKGMATPLLLTGGVNSILFGTQFNLVQELVRRRGGEHVTEATLQENIVAAVVSGAFISLFVTPMEGIKGRLQVQYTSGNGYRGPVDCAVQVYKKLGLFNG